MRMSWRAGLVWVVMCLGIILAARDGWAYGNTPAPEEDSAQVTDYTLVLSADPDVSSGRFWVCGGIFH